MSKPLEDMSEGEVSRYIDRVIPFLEKQRYIYGIKNIEWSNMGKKMGRLLAQKLELTRIPLIQADFKVWGACQFLHHNDLSLSRQNYNTLLLIDKFAKNGIHVDPFQESF